MKIKEIINEKVADDIDMTIEQEEFKKRLEVLEKRKEEKSENNQDMW